MALEIPDPEAGLVIHYSYLWRDDHLAGLEEGTKDRPCAIILAVENTAKGKHVVVAPITHTPPDNETPAIRVPPQIAKRIGLDERPQWIIIAELNHFTWPGHDIRAVPNKDPASIAYGYLPQNFTNALIQSARQSVATTRAPMTPRDE